MAHVTRTGPDARPDPNALHIIVGMDLPVQQDCEALGTLLQISRRCPVHSPLHHVWIPPRHHQVMGDVDPRRGELILNHQNSLPCTDHPLQTTWGSRDGADTDDGIRMMKLPAYGASPPTDKHDGRKSETFEYAQEMQMADQLPAYDTHRKHQTIPLLMTPYND